MSLVLVLAMAVSMFGVVASAKDINEYPDVDEITYTEAVAVLSGIGILEGDEDGFRPTGELTRAEAAKIAVYLVGLQNSNITKESSFTDIADHWAKNWITLAENAKLVNGNGDGTYEPEGKLTGYAWEKMVLCALGYDAKIEGMLGDSWETGVATLANKIDLLAGLKGYDATKAITREQAAQIAFTALNTKTVVYPISGSSNSIAVETKKTLGEEHFALDMKPDADAYGRPNKTYTYNCGDRKTVIDQEPAVVYTTQVTYKDNIEKDLGRNAKLVNGWEDGKTATVTNWLSSWKTNNKAGAQGKIIEFYETEKRDEYTVVVVNTYVQKLDGITKYTKDINLTAANVKIPVGDYQNGDVVAYTVGNNVPKGEPAQVDIETLEGVVGTVTVQNKTEGYVRIDDGEAVKLNYNCNEAIANLAPKTAKTFYYYNGDIMYVDAAPDVINDVAFVLEVETLKDPANSYLINPSKDEYVSAMRVLTLDGQVTVVDRALYEDKGVTYFANLNSTAEAAVAPIVVKDPYIGHDGHVNSFREIGEVEGGYAICHTSHNAVVSDLKEGQTTIKVNGADKYVTKDTNVTVFTYDEMSKTVTETKTYTGYDEFPKTATEYKTAYVAARGDVVTDIYAVEMPMPKPETVYGVFKAAGDNTGKGQQYVFYVDGMEKPYTVNDKVSVPDGNWTAGAAYKLTTERGEITKAEYPTWAASNGLVTKNENDYIVVNGVSYKIDENTVIVDHNKDCLRVDASIIQPNVDYVYLTTKADAADVAEFIFIVKQ